MKNRAFNRTRIPCYPLALLPALQALACSSDPVRVSALPTTDAAGAPATETSATSTVETTATDEDLRAIAQANGTLSYELTLLPEPENVRIDRDVSVPTSDGSSVLVNVYRPDAEGPYPTLVVVTPYGKDAGPSDYGPGLESDLYERDGSSIGRLPLSPLTAFEAPDPAYWVAQGYAMVVADLKLPDIFMPAGTAKARDVIEWAGTQDFSNANVGMIGVSALAIVQYGVAALQPAHLKAIVPWEGVSNEYRDTAFPGGIPETRFHLRGATLDDAIASGSFDTVAQQAQLARVTALEPITVPALLCGSWSDQGLHTRGSFEAFRRISSSEKWLYTHGGKKWETFYSPEALAYQTEFLDHYLKAAANGWPATPRVRLAVRDTQTRAAVRTEAEFPIARTQYRKLYLGGAGKLTFEPEAAEQTIRYGSDSAGAHFDITFTEDTELSGYMNLHVVVSATTSDDADLIVGIHKLDRAGLELPFYGMDGYYRGAAARGWLRVSQRALDPQASTEWQPVYEFDGEQKIVPGERYAVEVAILPSSTLFHAGETLRLSIAGRDTLDYGRIKYELTVTDGDTNIFTGADNASYLLVPVIPASNVSL